MLVSPAKALKLFKVSKPTLYADMKSGTLSFTKTDKGRRQIDIAELDRLYATKEKAEEGAENKTVKNRNKNTVSNQNEHSETALLQQQVEFLNREVRSKDDMISQWQEAFDKAQKTADKITALLEHNSSKYQSDANFEAMEKVIDDLRQQNERLIKVEEDRRRRADERRKERQRQLEQEQGRGLWGKLFGKV